MINSIDSKLFWEECMNKIENSRSENEKSNGSENENIDISNLHDTLCELIGNDTLTKISHMWTGYKGVLFTPVDVTIMLAILNSVI